MKGNTRSCNFYLCHNIYIYIYIYWLSLSMRYAQPPRVTRWRRSCKTLPSEGIIQDRVICPAYPPVIRPDYWIYENTKCWSGSGPLKVGRWRLVSILETIDISRYNITRYCTQCNHSEGKTSTRVPIRERHPYLALAGELWLSFVSYWGWGGMIARYRKCTVLCWRKVHTG